MNYLAHSYLAFSDDQILGQFLEDWIRNVDRFSFSAKVQQGITMHRAIDTFTDMHPEISKAKKMFSPVVRLYSGAFVDVAMDYFLANDPNIKTEKEWKTHSARVYSILRTNVELFPARFHKVLDAMEKDDWLYNYREDWGIGFSMKNVLNKAKYLEKDLPVFEVFIENKNQLEEHYHQFFPDLVAFCEKLNKDLN